MISWGGLKGYHLVWRGNIEAGEDQKLLEMEG